MRLKAFVTSCRSMPCLWLTCLASRHVALTLTPQALRAAASLRCPTSRCVCLGANHLRIAWNRDAFKKTRAAVIEIWSPRRRAECPTSPAGSTPPETYHRAFERRSSRPSNRALPAETLKRRFRTSIQTNPANSRSRATIKWCNLHLNAFLERRRVSRGKRDKYRRALGFRQRRVRGEGTLPKGLRPRRAHWTSPVSGTPATGARSRRRLACGSRASMRGPNCRRRLRQAPRPSVAAAARRRTSRIIYIPVRPLVWPGCTLNTQGRLFAS